MHEKRRKLLKKNIVTEKKFVEMIEHSLLIYSSLNEDFGHIIYLPGWNFETFDMVMSVGRRVIVELLLNHTPKQIKRVFFLKDVHEVECVLLYVIRKIRRRAFHFENSHSLEVI